MSGDSEGYIALVILDLILAGLTIFFVYHAVDLGGNFIFFSAFSGFFFLVTTSALIFCLFKKGKK